MAVKFQDEFRKLQNSNLFKEVTHPLGKFEMESADARTSLVGMAESRFNNTNGTMQNFYWALFSTLYEAGLSHVTGVLASSMYVVYNNACKVFPMFGSMTFTEQYKMMRLSARRTRMYERMPKGYAMNMYFAIVHNGLDMIVNLPNDEYRSKVIYTSPWRAVSMFSEWKEYKKVLQKSHKMIVRYDNKEYGVFQYPTWAMYKPTDNVGLTRTLLASDMWTLLIEDVAKYPVQNPRALTAEEWAE